MAGSSLTPTEQQVLDAWEAGHSIDRIARDTGFRRDSVGSIISMFRVDGAEDRVREAAIRSASALYAAAVLATGKVFR